MTYWLCLAGLNFVCIVRNAYVLPETNGKIVRFISALGLAAGIVGLIASMSLLFEQPKPPAVQEEVVGRDVQEQLDMLRGQVGDHEKRIRP